MPQLLIQLIGKQTIPNLVCIKALRLDVVLNVYTEHTRDALAAYLAAVEKNALPEAEELRRKLLCR